jgi:hypothetical protein
MFPATHPFLFLGIMFIYHEHGRRFTISIEQSDVTAPFERAIRLVTHYEPGIRAYYEMEEIRKTVLAMWDELEKDEKFLFQYVRGGWLKAIDGAALAFVNRSDEELQRIVGFAYSQPVVFINLKANAGQVAYHFLWFADLFREAHRKRFLYRRAEEFPRAHHGFVYLMHLTDTKFYKIGFSINPDRRAAEIIAVSGMPFEIEVQHRIASNQITCLEDELHTKYSAKRHSPRNEWFMLDDTDIAEIKSKTEVNYEWIDDAEWAEILNLPPALPTADVPSNDNPDEEDGDELASA